MARILAVDDEPDFLDTFDKILSEEGHKVIRSSNGDEGMKKVLHNRFDIILTDLAMPKIDGDKFIEMMEKELGQLPCPIIISSGRIDPAIVNKYSKNKQVHFLPKPVFPKELIAMINSILNKSTQKTSVDVRFLNPILEAIQFVIHQMTASTVTPGRPGLKQEHEISGDISGVVGVVSSGFNGTIALSFPESTFLKIIGKMLGEEYHNINDENKDAVAELVNIIFGHAKKTLNEDGMSIQPAIPQIVCKPKHILEHRSKGPILVIPFSSPDMGEFKAEISLIK